MRFRREQFRCGHLLLLSGGRGRQLSHCHLSAGSSDWHGTEVRHTAPLAPAGASASGLPMPGTGASMTGGAGFSTLHQRWWPTGGMRPAWAPDCLSDFHHSFVGSSLSLISLLHICLSFLAVPMDLRP